MSQPFREQTLRRYFEGNLSASVLDSEAVGSLSRAGIETTHRIEDMPEEFTITVPMVLALCDGFLSGELSAKALGAIAFMCLASDRFEWTEEDQIIAELFNDWSSPEINYALTKKNIARCRRWLLGEERST